MFFHWTPEYIPENGFHHPKIRRNPSGLVGGELTKKVAVQLFGPKGEAL